MAVSSSDTRYRLLPFPYAYTDVSACLASSKLFKILNWLKTSHPSSWVSFLSVLVLGAAKHQIHHTPVQGKRSEGTMKSDLLKVAWSGTTMSWISSVCLFHFYMASNLTTFLFICKTFQKLSVYYSFWRNAPSPLSNIWSQTAWITF